MRRMWGRALGAASVAVAVVVLAGSAAPAALSMPAAPFLRLPGAPNCPIFPATNVWNTRVDALPVKPNSATMISAIGPDVGLHPDFGSFAGYGIPVNVVTRNQATHRVRFVYKAESNHVPYPIPAHPKIEHGSDRHMIIVNRGTCRLYELFAVRHTATGWRAGSGAVWSLTSDHLRPNGWTSADAAGLPILPGLVRHSEVKAGVINHALRFTASHTCNGHIYPARHHAGSGSCANWPPMGLRVRLKGSFRLSGLPRNVRIIGKALKRYGMILADNGSPWYISGFSNPRFDDAALHLLDQIHGSDLEVVDTSTLRNG
jgi:hypothetical protein